MTAANPLRVWDGVRWRPDVADMPACSVIAAPPANTVYQATTTTLTLSASTVNTGSSVTLTATVAGGTPPAASSVRFEVYYSTTGTWETLATDTASPWTTTHTPTSVRRQYRAVYLGATDTTPNPDVIYQSSTSATKTVTLRVLTSFVKTYNATWTMSYSGGGSQRGADPIYQGYYSTTWDLQKSAIGFPYATIQSDLSGYEDITKVELYLYAEHWGPDGGGTAVVKTHDEATSSAPGTWGALSGLGGSTDSTPWSTKTGGKWCDITSLGVLGWANGSFSGVALNPSSTATEYYGYFSGKGGTNPPQLRITYTKWV